MNSTILGFQDQRRTRYRCTDQPPPDLKQVCKAIAKAVRPKRGELLSISKSEIKSRAKSASGTYDEPGPQDDLFRFLDNNHVIVEANGSRTEFYYDADQAEAVLRCCRDGRLPPTPAGTVEERIALLRERAMDRHANADDSCESSALEPEYAQPSVPLPAAPAPPPAPREVTAALFTDAQLDAMDPETLVRALTDVDRAMKPLQTLSAAIKARIDAARRAFEDEARREEAQAKAKEEEAALHARKAAAAREWLKKHLG
ncbi:hypothetical protein EPO34_01650 [Patescibacteria group bacterium]|nr:MAG: hypothetical protein EPO34_01650 [Patescibacteria group bacterium]